MKKLFTVCLAGLLLVTAFVHAGEKIIPADARALIASDPAVVLLDVRTSEEFTAGHIKGAVLLPYDAIDENSAKKFIKTKETTVIVYCRSGRRSAVAVTTLNSLGYTRVLDLGGVLSWPYGLVSGIE